MRSIYSIEQHHLIPKLAVARWYQLRPEREKPENTVMVLPKEHGCLEGQARTLIRQAMEGESRLLRKLDEEYLRRPPYQETDDFIRKEVNIRNLIADWLLTRLLKVVS